MAQLVARTAGGREVAGSSPVTLTRNYLLHNHVAPQHASRYNERKHYVTSYYKEQEAAFP